MTIALTNIREQAYSVIRSAINNNKISGSVVTTAFPEANPVFPVYIVPMQTVTLSSNETLGGSKRTYTLSAEVEVFAKVEDGPVVIAQMLDSVQTAFDGVDLSSDNLIFEDLDASNIDKVEINRDKLYTAGLILRFTFIK